MLHCNTENPFVEGIVWQQYETQSDGSNKSPNQQFQLYEKSLLFGLYFQVKPKTLQQQ
jgi:hypothetical protein